MNNEKDIWVYPISLNYRKNWGIWESIREITQNMMDTNAEFKIIKTSDGLILKDFGTGLKKKHLLLGVSEKPNDSRGKFGEGLKFAILVLKRLGYDVIVKSKNLKITVDTTTIENEKCLKLYIDESYNDVTGTEVFIKGYTGDAFEENFVRNNKDILFSSGNDHIIKEKNARLYVKDIYVCELENAMWSYNLSNISLSEDRNIPSEYSLKDRIGRLFSKLHDSKLIEEVFQAILDEKYEQSADMSYVMIHFKDAWVTAFKSFFGDNAVIYTNDNWEREAKWVGAKVIRLPREISDGLQEIIQTDKEYVLENNNKDILEIPDQKLSEEELKNLDILRNLSDIVSIKTKVIVALFDTSACYNPKKDIIFINKDIIANLRRSISSLVHELAHTFGCDDMTEEMMHTIGNVAGQLLYKFVKEKYSPDDESGGLGSLFD